ncbi:hypothetical protein [Lactobacillus crispatus]|uniref:hypothetical protein n=1 Tax=Lactobacillus crispatus TaxID=47770 RepID=UPI0016878F2E|nr:hypothetical protein [Lactobacillus crispatus]
MTKIQLTKEIEKALIEKYCSNNLKKYYGALEVPCANWLGKGKQNIDFATYEPRTQDINCYEIKITKADFNSGASLSFLGNRNYLVVPYELGKYLADNWHNKAETENWTHSKLPYSGIGVIAYLPEKYDELMEKYAHVAILNQALNDYNHVSDKFVTLIKCKRKEVHLEQKMSLIEGILRAGCRDATKAYLNDEFL